jgi:hypothetical protein
MKIDENGIKLESFNLRANEPLNEDGQVWRKYVAQFYFDSNIFLKLRTNYKQSCNKDGHISKAIYQLVVTCMRFEVPTADYVTPCRLCNRSLPSFLGRGGCEQRSSVGPVRTRLEPAPKGYELAEGEC